MKIGVCLSLVVLSGLVSSLLTRRVAHRAEVPDTAEYTREQSKLEFDWLTAGHNHYYWKLATKEATEEEKLQWLTETFESQMWYSIPGLYECTVSAATDESDREASKRILGRMVAHFKEHPREAFVKEDTDFVEEFNKEEPQQEDNPALDDIKEKLQEPLAEMDSFVDELQSAVEKKDVRIRKILQKVEAEQAVPPKSDRAGG